MTHHTTTVDRPHEDSCSAFPKQPSSPTNDAGVVAAQPETHLPLLRADTAQFLGHVIAHTEALLRMARRGKVHLGRPEEAAEQLIVHIRAFAPDFIEWGR